MKKLTVLVMIVSIVICACQNQRLSHSIWNEQQGLDYVVITEKKQSENTNIQYPVLDFANQNNNSVNRVLRECVNAHIDNFVSSELIALNLQFRTICSAKNAISFEFYGTLHAKEAAYPSTVIFTVNLLLEEGCVIRLTDMFVINEDFLNRVRLAWKKQVVSKSIPELVDYLEGFTDDDLATWLLVADSSKSDVFSSYDKKCAYIHFPVPHAVGDYFSLVISL